MKGKMLVLLLVLGVIATGLACWFLIQYVIDAYDIERAMSTTIEKYLHL
ncbi:hypothetical protein KFZ58_05400 [Virgibacillus sp. NKC19-16]|nr:hypothetical protein [Virgibacillus sp. NKC19-16]UJL47329.1 hypothetical protein KFZ58_05400 [Virgibacillus sp. NKC19-16]